jgi:hypothetical protein
VPLVESLLELFVSVVSRPILLFGRRLGTDEAEETGADDLLLVEVLVLVPLVEVGENVVDEAAFAGGKSESVDRKKGEGGEEDEP